MSEHHPNKPEQSHKAYSGLLDRLKAALESAEEKTLSGIQYDIDQAIELESAAEEMTREEIGLLGAYLKRDIKHLNQFAANTGKGVAEWLKFDIHLLEDRLANLLLSVADKTILQQEQLSRAAETEDELYTSGDYVLGGTFACENCGDIYVFTKPAYLESCVECGGDNFSRKTED